MVGLYCCDYCKINLDLIDLMGHDVDLCPICYNQVTIWRVKT